MHTKTGKIWNGEHVTLQINIHCFKSCQSLRNFFYFHDTLHFMHLGFKKCSQKKLKHVHIMIRKMLCEIVDKLMKVKMRLQKILCLIL